MSPSAEQQHIAQVLYIPPNAKRNGTDSNADNASSEEAKSEEPVEPIAINLNEVVQQEASKAYWTEFAEQLENKNFDRLFELLEEIKSRLKSLTPSRTDRHTQLDRDIDIEHLKDMVAHNALGGEDFGRLFETTWKHIRDLHVRFLTLYVPFMSIFFGKPEGVDALEDRSTHAVGPRH